MSTIITDGTGKGYKLRVDQSNRVRSHAITESEQLHAIEEGDGYNVNTGLISITGDATLLYIKNNDEADLVIDTIIIGTGQGITHSDSPYAYLQSFSTTLSRIKPCIFSFASFAILMGKLLKAWVPPGYTASSERFPAANHRAYMKSVSSMRGSSVPTVKRAGGIV